MDYYKDRLRKECIAEYFDTFRYTLDALEFVPAKYLKKVHRQIFSDMQRSNKEIDREYRRYRWQKFWQNVKARRAERKGKRKARKKTEN